MTSPTFLEVATSRAWYADPRLHDSLTFGAESQLVLAIKQAAGKGDFKPVLKGIDELLQNKQNLSAFLGEDAGYPIRSGMAVLRGFRESLRGLQEWCNHRHSVPLREMQQHFKRAICSFQLAWGQKATGQKATGAPLAEKSPIHETTNELLREVFLGLGKRGTGTGFWITWDLATSLLGAMEGRAEKPLVRGAATTPIVLVQHTPPRGLLAWLTVELLDGAGCGFEPDPLALGLTAVRDYGAGEIDFVDSLRNVWNKSGISSCGRGRWRITMTCPQHDPRFAGQDPFFPRRFEGRSAEAAALAAIWTASGRIPYDPEFLTVGGLALDVAISASLGDLPTDKPLTDISVLPVRATGLKIQAAEKLDTLIFADDEETTTAEDDILAAQNQVSYRALRINRVGTMADTLDLLLVTNRHLAKHQAEVRERWLCQWRIDNEKSTGQAAFDTGKWNEDMSVAARAKYSPRRYS